jgi:hypothetical protein
MPASHLPSVEVLALRASAGLLGQEVAGDDKDIPRRRYGFMVRRERCNARSWDTTSPLKTECTDDARVARTCCGIQSEPLARCYPCRRDARNLWKLSP